MANGKQSSVIGTRNVSEFGDELQRLMAERGIGVRELARQVPCSAGHISQLRHGQKRASLQTARRVDEVLDAGGTLIALVTSDAGGKIRQVALERPARPPAAGAQAAAHADSRRGPSRVLEALQTAASGGGADLDSLSGLILHYSQVIMVTPSTAVYDDLLSVRSFAGSLLGQHSHTSDRRRPDLVVTAGWLSSLLAITATDIGDHAAALVWCSDTERRGRDAGHPELLGWAALTRALIAYYQGQAHRSAALARYGQQVTALGTVAHAKLAAQEMRSLAMQGDADGMASAWRHAATAMGRLPPGTATTGAFSVPCVEDPPYVATSLLLVRRYQDAAEATSRIIETVYRPQPGDPRDQPTKYARTLLILGLAEAGLGRIEEASAAGSSALGHGQLTWTTMVLAGKLDRVLAGSSPASTHAADYHARYLDAAERMAWPAGGPRARIPHE